MSALSIQKKIETANVAQSGVFTDVFEVTNFKDVSVQLSKTGVGKGTAILRQSNDGTNWSNVNTTVYPNATVAVAAGAASVMLEATIRAAHVQIQFTEDGTGAVVVASGKWIAKQH